MEDMVNADEPKFGDEDGIVDLGDEELDLEVADDNFGFSLDTEREFEE